MKKNKKGISGVIAVSLILIIAVMSILQFQIWLEGYSQNIFNNVEMQNKDLEKNNFKINTIISNQLYLTNNLENDVEIKDVKLNSIDCNIHTNITHGTESISIKECLNKTNTSQIDVTVITQNNIYDKYIYSPKELEKSNNILTPPIEVGLSMVWNKSFYAKQSSDTMYNPNIQIDSSDNLYILGEEQTYSLIAKYNEDGQQIWNFTLPNPSYNIRINNLVIDNNNNFFYIVGSDSNKMFVSKYDLSGSNVWNKTYGVSDDETETYGLTVGQDGYLYVSGKKKEFSDHTNYYTIKLDNLGNIIGTLETNINSYESGSMTMPVDQEMTEEIKINNIGSKYIINREPSILIKLNNIDSSGCPDNICSGDHNVDWVKTIFDKNYFRTAQDLVIDNSNNMYIGGSQCDMVTYKCDISLIKLNSNGDILWEKTADIQNGHDEVKKLFIDKNGDIIATCITGESDDPYAGFMSMATIKYDNNGNELMRITHLDNTINEFVKGIVADSTGAFYLFSEYDGHLFLAKYK